MSNIETSLALIKEFFEGQKIDFWLEAGTALSAEREGRVFPWEHDIDVAIWRDDLPDPESLKDFFATNGYKVIFQKNYPYIDNIIQLKVAKGFEEKLFDIDIYLYTRHQGQAYMRWIHKPEGRLAKAKLIILNTLKYMVNPPTDKWRRMSRLIPHHLAKVVFFGFLRFYIDHSTCVYHRFPEHYFLNLKEIDFHGLLAKIPLDTSNYLQHRYGQNWNTPDSQFNQSGKWRQSNARVELKMNLLPIPVYDDRILS